PGTHTLRIEPSWGYQAFAGVAVTDAAGNVIVELTPPDAISQNVQARCDESDYCPSAFKSVNLAAGDAASYTIDAPSDGNYLLRIFYASGTGGMADVSVDGAGAVTGLVIEADTADVSTEQFALQAGTRTITVTATSGAFNIDFVQLLRIGGEGTAAERDELPEGYALDQNYPNPFNPQTTIRYEMGAAGRVTLAVYDLLGRRVATLVDGSRPAGVHQVTFDGSLLPSGVYFYRLETAVGQQIRSMVLVK
ncbi:MAG TPA: T9SS type A sorting domain-containing protein, partial [Rhodothermales bacterium]